MFSHASTFCVSIFMSSKTSHSFSRVLSDGYHLPNVFPTMPCNAAFMYISIMHHSRSFVRRLQGFAASHESDSNMMCLPCSVLFYGSIVVWGSHAFTSRVHTELVIEVPSGSGEGKVPGLRIWLKQNKISWTLHIIVDPFISSTFAPRALSLHHLSSS